MILYDITDVCTMLGTTSRTLRYYEEQGLIESTITPPSARRKYSEEQIDAVKHVLALRTLGLSVTTIKDLLKEKISLGEAIDFHRADIIRLINEKQKELCLLEEVLQGNSRKIEAPILEIACSEKQLEIATLCVDAMLAERYEALTPYFSEDMKNLIPVSALAYSFKKTISPVGAYVKKREQTRSAHSPNTVYQILKYEKMSVRIRFVFHGDLICGLWFDYVK